jgi:hypothetical protein
MTNIDFARQLELQDEVLTFLKSEAGRNYLDKHYRNTTMSAVDVVIDIYNNWPVSQ